MATDILTGMRVFTAVVDAGSFAAAADKLDLSRGMTSRYVAQVESHLGVRLLNRTTRRLSLTERAATITSGYPGARHGCGSRDFGGTGGVGSARDAAGDFVGGLRGPPSGPGNHRIPAVLPGRGGRRHAERPRGGSGRGGIRCCGARRRAHRSGARRAPSHARAHRGLRFTRLPEEARRAEIARGPHRPQLHHLRVLEPAERVALPAQGPAAQGPGVGKPAAATTATSSSMPRSKAWA